jgi:hypothetical protein
MKNTQKHNNDYKNITSIDSNFSLNGSIDENTSYFKVTQKSGEIEMIINEPYIDYNDPENNTENDDVNNDENDDLSEFSQYRDYEFDSNDDLESNLDFKFDFDIIFTPENNSELLQITEIKSKIVNRIKLNALDISYIKRLEDCDKFDLIKLFNHMV